jgi:hypothetical protein
MASTIDSIRTYYKNLCADASPCLEEIRDSIEVELDMENRSMTATFTQPLIVSSNR